MKTPLLPQLFYYRKPRLVSRQHLGIFQLPIRKLERLYYFRPRKYRRPYIRFLSRRKKRRRNTKRKRLLNLLPYEIARTSFDIHKLVSYSYLYVKQFLFSRKRKFIQKKRFIRYSLHFKKARRKNQFPLLKLGHSSDTFGLTYALFLNYMLSNKRRVPSLLSTSFNEKNFFSFTFPKFAYARPVFGGKYRFFLTAPLFYLFDRHNWLFNYFNYGLFLRSSYGDIEGSRLPVFRHRFIYPLGHTFLRKHSSTSIRLQQRERLYDFLAYFKNLPKITAYYDPTSFTKKIFSLETLYVFFLIYIPFFFDLLKYLSYSFPRYLLSFFISSFIYLYDRFSPSSVTFYNYLKYFIVKSSVSLFVYLFPKRIDKYGTGYFKFFDFQKKQLVPFVLSYQGENNLKIFLEKIYSIPLDLYLYISIKRIFASLIAYPKEVLGFFIRPFAHVIGSFYLFHSVLEDDDEDGTFDPLSFTDEELFYLAILTSWYNIKVCCWVNPLLRSNFYSFLAFWEKKYSSLFQSLRKYYSRYRQLYILPFLGRHTYGIGRMNQFIMEAPEPAIYGAHWSHPRFVRGVQRELNDPLSEQFTAHQFPAHIKDRGRPVFKSDTAIYYFNRFDKYFDKFEKRDLIRSFLDLRRKKRRLFFRERYKPFEKIRERKKLKMVWKHLDIFETEKSEKQKLKELEDKEEYYPSPATPHIEKVRRRYERSIPKKLPYLFEFLFWQDRLSYFSTSPYNKDTLQTANWNHTSFTDDVYDFYFYPEIRALFFYYLHYPREYLSFYLRSFSIIGFPKTAIRLEKVPFFFFDLVTPFGAYVYHLCYLFPLRLCSLFYSYLLKILNYSLFIIRFFFYLLSFPLALFVFLYKLLYHFTLGALIFPFKLLYKIVYLFKVPIKNILFAWFSFTWSPFVACLYIYRSLIRPFFVNNFYFFNYFFFSPIRNFFYRVI